MPDVLLTDVMMPKLDGFALLKRIRQSERFRQLPVIMCRHGRARKPVPMRELPAADDYVVKRSRRASSQHESRGLEDGSAAAGEPRRASAKRAHVQDDCRPGAGHDLACGSGWKSDLSELRWYAYTGQVPPSAEGLAGCTAFIPRIARASNRKTKKLRGRGAHSSSVSAMCCGWNRPLGARQRHPALRCER